MSIPYSGKTWQGECLANLLFSSIWQMNRSAKGLLIVTTTLDDFSLANHRQLVKVAKLSTRQTFPLYGTWKCFGYDDEAAKKEESTVM